MTQALEKVAFDHVVACLRAQHNDLVNLRNQASISAAITGLVATVFATLLDKTESTSLLFGTFALGFSFPAVLLLSVFATSIALSISVVIHFHEFEFSFEGKRMLENARREPSPENFYALYVSDGEYFFQENEKKISTAQSMLWWAMVLGWMQIVPWLMLIRV